MRLLPSLRPVTTPAMRSRARGCLFGQLAGDALGSLVEFKSSGEIARLYPDGGPHRIVAGGTWNTLAGQPTDDSEMALAMARSIVAEGGYDARAVGAAYVAWGDSRPFDMGGTTRSALASLRKGEPPVTGQSQANGALMRAAPLGILFAGDLAGADTAAVVDAELTHPHPVCRLVNTIFVSTISLLIAGEVEVSSLFDHAFDLIEECDDEAARTAVGLRLSLAEAGDFPGDYQSQMGWVLTAFQNAFAHLARCTGFAKTIVDTVREGGDCDTNAAIAGALMGALHGEEKLPTQWREAIESCRPDAASGAVHVRPAAYWPNDAVRLADALLGFGGEVVEA